MLLRCEVDFFIAVQVDISVVAFDSHCKIVAPVALDDSHKLPRVKGMLLKSTNWYVMFNKFQFVAMGI